MGADGNTRAFFFWSLRLVWKQTILKRKKEKGARGEETVRIVVMHVGAFFFSVIPIRSEPRGFSPALRSEFHSHSAAASCMTCTTVKRGKEDSVREARGRLAYFLLLSPFPVLFSVVRAWVLVVVVVSLLFALKMADTRAD